MIPFGSQRASGQDLATHLLNDLDGSRIVFTIRMGEQFRCNVYFLRNALLCSTDIITDAHSPLMIALDLKLSNHVDVAVAVILECNPVFRHFQHLLPAHVR